MSALPARRIHPSGTPHGIVRASAVLVTVVLSGACGSATTPPLSPSPADVAPSTPQTAVVVASPPVSSATASTASAAPSLATVYPVGAAGAIVFYRPAEDDPNPISNAGTPFAILPDGSNEVRLGADLPGGVWSPDGSRLAFPRFVPAVSPVPGGQADWMRPVVMTADGSMRLLAADSPRSMHLIPLAWTADGSALYVLGGSEAVEPSDRGLFTVRASDGGNLRRLPIATREGFDQEFDVVGGGSTILVKEIEPRSDGPDHSI